MRAAVFDDRGARLAIAYRPIESRMGEGLIEQDPDEWWRAGEAVLDEVLLGTGTASRVRILTTTASAGCLVAVGAAREGPSPRRSSSVTFARASRPRRSRRCPRSWRSGSSGMFQVTPDLMLPKIAWLRDHEPAVFEATRSFASPNDFLVQRLTGCLVTDRPNASKFFHGDARFLPGGADLVVGRR